MATRRRSPKRPKIAQAVPLPPRLDVDQLARVQGVEPVEHPKELKANFWPADEPAEDFIAAFRHWRRDDITQSEGG